MSGLVEQHAPVNAHRMIQPAEAEAMWRDAPVGALANELVMDVPGLQARRLHLPRLAARKPESGEVERQRSQGALGELRHVPSAICSLTLVQVPVTTTAASAPSC
jgi:hypothetical protein